MNPDSAKRTPPGNNDSDADLMVRAGRGDDSAFAALVDRHHRTVMNLVHRFLGPVPEREDLAQDVFVRLYQARSKYQPKAKFTTFLYRTTLNLCLNHIRDNKHRRVLSIDALVGQDGSVSQIPDPRAEGPPVRLSEKERARAVRRAVDELPENQRAAIILSRFENLSYKEIADTLDVSVMAVKSLLSRAKENLRARLEMLLRDEEWMRPRQT